jgi:lycopene cyclase domain-containing protein
MNFLYLLLDISVLFFPLLLSFDKKVAFFKKWKSVLGAFVFVGIPFLVHDYFFTHIGVWGFEPDYLSGIYLLNLPLEEVLFFVVVPYACVFIYQCTKVYFPTLVLRKFNAFLYLIVLLYSLTILVIGFGAWYSTMASVSCLFLLLFLFVKPQNQYIPLSFLLSLIPFFIMNSVLTGSVTPNPVVWYDPLQNVGFRWGSIPAEDLLYSFLLIVLNILVFERFEKKAIN